MADSLTKMKIGRRDITVALAAAGFGAAMFGLAYASVPLYDLFCRVTGFGGRTMVAQSLPKTITDREIEIRFDSNVAAGLPWRFDADHVSMNVRPGEPNTMTYRVTNLSARMTTGLASFNVTPVQNGQYFNKIQCFCFTEQTLKPGETAEFTVVFFVDPEIDNNRETRNTNTITLSYTFFPVKKDIKPLADRGNPVSVN